MSQLLYKNKVLEYLKQLSDESFQRRVWLASSGPEISSFIEAVCGLFDDSGLGDLLKKNTIAFSEETDALLRELHQAVHDVGISEAPSVLIRDPKMDKVRELSANILNQIASIE